MASLKPKLTTLEQGEETVSLVFEFSSVEEADRAADKIEAAMVAGTLVVNCGESGAPSRALLAAAKEVMAALQEHGSSIVPHLMDSDQNAGQRLRDAIAEAEAR